ncbi:formyl peptide receptor 2-like [Leptodactylus fuscus]
MGLTSTLLCLLRSLYKDYETPNTTDSIYDHIFQKTSITLYSIIFVLGIIGNGLVIWIAGFRMKKTISAVWFLHLAIADFLCCASLPVRIVQELYTSPYQPFVDPLCILTIILFTLNVGASAFLLTAMSIDRCVSVMWPFWAKVNRTRRLVRITAGGVWGLSFLMAALVCYSNRWCITSTNDNDRMYIQKIKETTRPIRLVIMFVIPFLIILTSYVIIFIKLRTSKRPRRSQRPYRIITAVILCFFLCLFPYYIWPLIPRVSLSYIQFHVMNIIVNNLACLNSCINPIIYVFMSQDFRQGFFRSIPARLEKALDEQTEVLCRERENTCVTYQ